MVSLAANNVSVKSTKQEGGSSVDHTFSFAATPGSAIVRDGRRSELKELQKGDSVTVTYETTPGGSLYHLIKVVAIPVDGTVLEPSFQQFRILN